MSKKRTKKEDAMLEILEDFLEKDNLTLREKMFFLRTLLLEENELLAFTKVEVLMYYAVQLKKTKDLFDRLENDPKARKEIENGYLKEEEEKKIVKNRLN